MAAVRRFDSLFSLPALILVAAAAHLLLPATLSGAPQWKRVESPHFEMYTISSEGRARAMLTDFERVAQFFEETMQRPLDSAKPIRIIVVDNRRDWERLIGKKFIGVAFYQSGFTRDYIVMSEVSIEAQQVAAHEFTHLIVSRAGYRFPLWLNEGIADLYSTLKQEANQVRVGEAPLGRLVALHQQGWISAQELLNATRESRHYNEKNRASIFYSQSWLLVHMLMLGKEYREKGLQLMAALGEGGDSEKAFASIMGMAHQDVDGAMRSYFRGGRVQNLLFPLKLSRKFDLLPAEPLSSAQIEATESFLSAYRDESRSGEMAEQLASRYPNDVAALESASELAWRAQKPEQALAYAKLAYRTGKATPALAWSYARILASQEPDSEDLIPAIESTLAADAANLDARLLLLEVGLQRRDYHHVLREGSRVKQVTPDKAGRYFRAMALAQWMSGGARAGPAVYWSRRGERKVR
jgi:hypothetical protein